MKGRIESIEVLRLLAAVSVFTYHCGIAGDAGYYGVDIFCILSGLVMMLSTVNEESEKGFLLRRILRIVPVYWIYTIAAYMAARLMPSASVMTQAEPVYLIKSLFFIPFTNERGYSVPILGAGWSLEYEVFFYLVFFISMKISHRNRGLICSFILLVLSIIGLIFDGLPMEIAFFTDPFILEFALGIGIYYLGGWLMKMEESRQHLKAACMVTAMILLMYLWLDPFKDPGLHRCIRLGIPSAVMVLCAVTALKDVRLPWALTYLGGTTYSFYLIGYLTAALYKIAAEGRGIMAQLLFFFLALAVTVGASIISCEILEKSLTGKIKHLILRKDEKSNRREKPADVSA